MLARLRRSRGLLFAGALAAGSAGIAGHGRAQDGPVVSCPPRLSTVIPVSPAIPAPAPSERPLPIDLPSALRLAGVRPLDIGLARERLRAAAARLELAQVLWLPTVTVGGDYNRHDGRNQDAQGNVFDNSRSSGMLGVGTGIGPAAVLDVGEAIFAPLVARQQVRAREADLQAASNDSLVAVSDAYFTVEQARGELAGATEATRRSRDLIARTRKLAPGIVPELELFRAETELARREQAELLAHERWELASADLLRVLRLDPSAQVEPAEPPQLRVELVNLQKPLDDLIPIGLTFRPELASRQAQVQATLTMLRHERLRPLIPSVLLRGYSTPVTGTLAAGYFGGGPNDSFGNGGLRSDLDLQVLWQLNNLGFGNRALVHQREAENRQAVLELFQIQDRVAAEIAREYASARLAAARVEVAERGLRAALASANKNLTALSETKGVGGQVVTLVRPQEAVAAVQALSQAYADYFGAVADANRAQFRLYRALGQPAQYLTSDGQPTCPPVLPQVAPPPRPAAETLPDHRTLSAEPGAPGASGGTQPASDTGAESSLWHPVDTPRK
jgi:outer membrane protein TolC